MTWHLVADSACDLHSLEGGGDRVDFTTIPFTIRIGGTEYIDNENIPVEEMIEANETHAEIAQTACPSPEDWREKFAAPGPVIAFTISSALSGSYNSACAAKTMMQEEDPGKQIAVIDSKATGPEEAMLIWKARNLILEGREFDAIERELNETAEKIHTSFALASYHNLGFWGIGIGNEQGEIAMRGRARGSRSMIRFLTEELQKVGLAGKQIVISHCMNEKDARDLMSALLAVFPDVKVLVQPTRGLDSFYAERGGLIVGY